MGQSRQRNEALDCRVYALAALKILNPVWSAISHRLNKEPVQKVELELKRSTQKVRPRRPQKNWATDLN